MEKQLFAFAIFMLPVCNHVGTSTLGVCVSVSVYRGERLKGSDKAAWDKNTH